jgi:hypothetical protein
MYRNLWVTSNVQFRKGAAISPFRVGLGWADLEPLFAVGCKDLYRTIHRTVNYRNYGRTKSKLRRNL